MFRLEIPLSFSVMLSVPTVTAADLSLDSAVTLFERATGGIQSYDVTMTVTRRWTAKSKVVGTRKIGPEDAPITEWQNLAPGEQGLVETHEWRQIRDAHGRRRIEKFSPSSGGSEGVTVFDGEVRRTLNESSKQGYLGPGTAGYVQRDEDYVTFFANEYGEVSLAKLLRERTGTRLVADASRPGAIVLDTPPQQGGSLAQYGYLVCLDANHGLLPSSIEVRRKQKDGDEVLWRRLVVRRFKKLDDRGWAPVEVATTSYATSGPIKGNATQEAVAVVNIAKSSWNKQFPDATFTIAFPKGVKVLDELRKVTYVTGNPNREENLDELLKQAKDILPNAAHYPKEPPRKSTNWALILVVALGIAIVLGVAVLVSLRYARLRSSD